MIKKAPVSYAFLLLLIFWQVILWWVKGWELSNTLVPDDFQDFGAPYAYDIYSGHVYGLLTNRWIHLEWWHWAFNLVALFFTMRLVEQKNGTTVTAILLMVFSFVSSAAQLALTGDAGIGATPIVFGYLNFMIAQKAYYWRVGRLKILLVILQFLLIAFALTNLFFDWLPIGVSGWIAAIISGFALGLVLNRQLHFSVTALILLSMGVIVAFFNPYSSEWNTYKGYQQIEKGQNQNAKEYFLKALMISPENHAAQVNLNQLLIDSLSDVAYSFHENEKFDSAAFYYRIILDLDTSSQWAINNLARLP